jgi:hypothetical protein
MIEMPTLAHLLGDPQTMKLPFEGWLEEQEMSDEAGALFAEGVTCYKTGAYRAAMILSYLAFQTVIRDRMLAAERPPGLTEARWRDALAKLRDEDRWDASTYDLIQQRKDPVFLIADDLRQQIAFYKNRRNDCAHSKRNRIEAPHVEAFWLFLRSSLARFVVSGSEGALLEKIRRHFDPSMTPPGRSFQALVAEIGVAVEPSNLSDFFVKVHGCFQDAVLPVVDQELLFLFLDGVLAYGSPRVMETVVRHLQADEQLLLPFLGRYPGRVAQLVTEETSVRWLWHEKLFTIRSQAFAVFSALLSHGLIPEEQRDEAIDHVIHKLRGELPLDDYFEALSQQGFFRRLHALAFGPDEVLIDEFHWANRNSRVVVYYLERFEPDLSIASAISDVFSRHNHPHRLRRDLQDFFTQNPAKLGRVRELIAERGFPSPGYIEAFVSDDGETSA